jgi:hypothetical protein
MAPEVALLGCACHCQLTAILHRVEYPELGSRAPSMLDDCHRGDSRLLPPGEEDAKFSFDPVRQPHGRVLLK